VVHFLLINRGQRITLRGKKVKKAVKRRKKYLRYSAPCGTLFPAAREDFDFAVKNSVE
jgi:hypothetical protein